MSNQDNGFIYKIMENIGYLIGMMIGMFFRLTKKGFMFAKENKIVLFSYIGLIFISLFAPVMIFVTIITMACIGLWQYIKEAPERRLKNYFNEIFLNIGLLENGQAPNYYGNEDVSDYVNAVYFYNLVPLSEWNKKKEKLEIYLREKIIDIRQDKKDNRYISLLLQKQPLPKLIEWNDSFLNINQDILNIGHSYLGMVGMDLNRYPHAFIGGETGSGKSNVLKCMIYQSIAKDYEIILIDFKRGVVFSRFQDIAPIHYEYTETLEILKNILIETKHRLDLFRNYGVEKLEDYNKTFQTPLKRKIIFIDELAELLSVRDKEISKLLYEYIETLTRISRAVGVHLIMGIQRPDSTVINGQIKSNVSFRLCGHFVDKEPSMIMLGNDKASEIMNIKGRFIAKDDQLKEVQCFYFKDDVITPHRRRFDNSMINNTKEEKQVASDTEIPHNEETQPNTFNFDFNDIVNK